MTQKAISISSSNLEKTETKRFHSLPTFLVINGKVSNYQLCIFRGDFYKSIFTGKKRADGWRVCYIDLENPPTGIHNEFEEGWWDLDLFKALEQTEKYLKIVGLMK